MKKLLLAAVPLVLLLGACDNGPFDKEEGQVVGKTTESSRFGPIYELDVSYPVSSGQYKISTVDLSGKQDEWNSFKVGQKVTVFVDSNGIKDVLK